MQKEKRRQKAEDMVRRYATEKRESAGERKTLPSANTGDKAFWLWIQEQVGKVVAVPLDRLVVKENVRFIVDADSAEFASLVADIADHGVEQNILVDLREGPEGDYELVVIAGQRRYLAAKQASKKNIDARIVRYSDRAERLARGLAENLHRKDLHPLERAEVYHALAEEGWSDEKIAHYYKLEAKTIQIFRRLGKYPEAAKSIIRRYPDKFSARLLFSKFLGKKWKNEGELLRALRQVAGEIEPLVKTRNKAIPELAEISKTVSASKLLSCKVTGTKEKGSVLIKYASEAGLQKLLTLLARS